MTRLTLLSLVPSTLSMVQQGITQYTLVDDYSYQNFFQNFNFFTGSDPTNGFVQYQSLNSAMINEYIGYLDESVYIGVDYKNKAPSGRPSVRLESKKTYNQGLLVANITHMPDSTCGNWPALWMFGDPWPSKGEVDIIEGANQQTVNAITLHTSTSCIVSNATVSPGGQGNKNGRLSFSGHMTTLNCEVDAAGQGKDVGCSIQAGSALPTYGTHFNVAGGGVYAMEWTANSISIWLFPHTGAIPSDITKNNPDPSGWGTPLAEFAGSGCDFSARFKDLKIVIDTTFCGTWAGAVWQSGGCADSTGLPTCEAYVRDNPAAFFEAYWQIAGLKWFQNPATKARRDNDPARRMPHQTGRSFWW